MSNVQTKKKPAAPVAMDMDFDIGDVGEEDEYYVARSHTSIRRYDLPPLRDAREDPNTQTGTIIRHRRSAIQPETHTGRITSKALTPPLTKAADAPSWHFPERLRHFKRLPLLATLLGMVIAISLVLSFNAIGNWWQIHQDDVTYGRPRTFQMDAVVGHSDSAAHPSHYIFINLNRHVVIIEMPGGDPAHARIYSGPMLFGDGQDLTPITAEFRDVNGDGKLDMIVMIQGQRLVYINDGTEFRPLRAGEQINLPSS